MSLANLSPKDRQRIVFTALRRMKHFPEDWDQDSWRCGTAYCFAGHLTIAAGYRFVGPSFIEEGRNGVRRQRPNDTPLACNDRTQHRGSAACIGAEILTGTDDWKTISLFSAGNSYRTIVEGCVEAGYITPAQGNQLLAGTVPGEEDDGIGNVA